MPGDVDITVSFGGQVKQFLEKLARPEVVSWLLLAAIVAHLLVNNDKASIEQQRQTAEWRDLVMKSIRDLNTVTAGHVKQAEHEAMEAQESRAKIADMMMIYCYNNATDAVQRRRCIERDVPTYDMGSYGRERRTR